MPGEPFGDGTYLVGHEIPPGRYRASPGDWECSWQRLSGFGMVDYLPVNISGATFSYTIVDIAATDLAFRSNNCGTWSSDLTPLVTPGEPFGGGTFLVGPEVAPGRYRASFEQEQGFGSSVARLLPVAAPERLRRGLGRPFRYRERGGRDGSGHHRRDCAHGRGVPQPRLRHVDARRPRNPTPTSRGAAPVGCLATTDRTATDRQTEERRWRPVPSMAYVCSSSRRSPQDRTAASTSPTSAPT